MRMQGVGLAACLGIFAWQHRIHLLLRFPLCLLPVATLFLYETYLRSVLQGFTGLYEAHSQHWGLEGNAPQLGLPLRDLMRFWHLEQADLQFDCALSIIFVSVGLLLMLFQRRWALAMWSAGVLIVGVSMTGRWALLGLRRVLSPAFFSLSFGVAGFRVPKWVTTAVLVLLVAWSMVKVRADIVGAYQLQKSLPTVWDKILQNESVRASDTPMRGFYK
jgi:hypothetical protein